MTFSRTNLQQFRSASNSYSITREAETSVSLGWKNIEQPQYILVNLVWLRTESPACLSLLFPKPKFLGLCFMLERGSVLLLYMNPIHHVSMTSSLTGTISFWLQLPSALLDWIPNISACLLLATLLGFFTLSLFSIWFSLLEFFPMTVFIWDFPSYPGPS